MAVYVVKPLPGAALAAAARFHAHHLPLIEIAVASLEETLTIIFPPADHTHRGWLLAAVQELARQYAPLRINAVTGGGEAAIAAAVRYLDTADGVTGQSLLLVGDDADAVLSSPQ